ncbi:hypothetical protein FRB90_003862 [Tulasnella sp. 427]|nr:hypothetical protein FRB90_003862 [Tulasnella sp. 427]
MESLPVELLSRIFVHVLPPHLDNPRHHAFDPARYHALICCVCQRWNQIAKATPELWTFIKVSYRAGSHDAMKRRLELSGELPLDISMRLLQDEDGLSIETLAPLLDQLPRWRSLRVDATVEAPSALRLWIPSELPNVEEMSLAVEVIEEVLEDDAESREPFISAPRLTFFSSNSPVHFSMTHCPLVQEYWCMGMGFDGFTEPSRFDLWRSFVGTLSTKCPRLEVLQVSEEGGVWDNDSFGAGPWATLSALKTLRFAIRANSATIRYFLKKLGAPELRLIEFKGIPVYNPRKDGLESEIRFPPGNDGRVLFSGMNLPKLIELLLTLNNISECTMEVDLASVIDGNPKEWTPTQGKLGLCSEDLETLRMEWNWVCQYYPRVIWIVPAGEGGGGLKILGGRHLSFDKAIAYLNDRMALRFNR